MKAPRGYIPAPPPRPNIQRFPHCDQSILHAPGECRYCDLHPAWQELRVGWRINFTGHTDPDKAPCPSEWFRGPEKRDAWGGNVAVPGSCDRPSPGWFCTLERDHDGPCPAWPDTSAWTAPATVGGSWVRRLANGIYEFARSRPGRRGEPDEPPSLYDHGYYR